MKIRQEIPLDKIKVAAPCSAEWRFMYGDDRVRFCGQCSQNVYNLSELTREQAEDLIRKTEGQLCVRFYRRKDGTILTNNCPVGLEAIKARYRSTKATIIRAVLALLAYIGVLSAVTKTTPDVGVLSVVTAPVESIVAHQRMTFMGALAPASPRTDSRERGAYSRKGNLSCYSYCSRRQCSSHKRRGGRQNHSL
jgi:hypothetical protein